MLSKLICWAWLDQAWPSPTNSKTAWLPYNLKTISMIFPLWLFYHLFESIICFINWNWLYPYFFNLLYLFFIWPELLHCVSSNKLAVVFTGGQISVVQALLEELPGQFLTYMRSRDIKPSPLHAASTSAWLTFTKYSRFINVLILLISTKKI